MNTEKKSLENENQPSYLGAVSGSRFVPMLFSTPMVLALLDKTKTETRRTHGLEKINENPDKWVFKQVSNLFYFTNKITEETICIKSKMNVGYIIWVRETFQNSLNKNEYCYKADTDNPIYLDKKWKWKPSLFMPKDACRIFLKCVSVHAERLQDINEQSAINEGIEIVQYKKMWFSDKKLKPEEIYYRDYDYLDTITNCSIRSYQSLWKKINGVNSWNKNPFVWVYKFVRVDAPDDFR